MWTSKNTIASHWMISMISRNDRTHPCTTIHLDVRLFLFHWKESEDTNRQVYKLHSPSNKSYAVSLIGSNIGTRKSHQLQR